MSLLKDKVAVVSGAGSGIGRAIAETYAREGAKVVVADVSVEHGEETVKTIIAAGGDAFFVKADSSVAEENKSLLKLSCQNMDVLM
jgi:NAD(P)-dependent dehydrogenase (short-subunit alcohol dehydrogenase family)